LTKNGILGVYFCHLESSSGEMGEKNGGFWSCFTWDKILSHV